jgi:hypothetical protein
VEAFRMVNGETVESDLHLGKVNFDLTEQGNPVSAKVVTLIEFNAGGIRDGQGKVVDPIPAGKNYIALGNNFNQVVWDNKFQARAIQFTVTVSKDKAANVTFP